MPGKSGPSDPNASSPDGIEENVDPTKIRDRSSPAYLAALLAQAQRDLGRSRSDAEEAGQDVATFSLPADIRFASAEARTAFTDELTVVVGELLRKYHEWKARDGIPTRLLIGAYPAPATPKRTTPSIPRPGKQAR